jgi:hypothetical protein
MSQFELTKSIIHKCPALKLPQSFAEKLGMTAQIVPLKGCDDEMAKFILDACNSALLPRPSVPVSDEQIKPRDGWAVHVEVDGERILSIESECLSGVPDIDRYADTVRNCAQHLLSFIGDGEPSDFFPPDDAPVATQPAAPVQEPDYAAEFKAELVAKENAAITRHLGRSAPAVQPPPSTPLPPPIFSQDHSDAMYRAGMILAGKMPQPSAPSVPDGAVIDCGTTKIGRHTITTWGGNSITLKFLLDSLHDYSRVMPISGRAQWAMKEALSVINALLAAAPAVQAPQEPVTLKPGCCHKCGLPLVANPHPEAGKPGHYLEVGCPTECLPCLVLNRHTWAQRAMKAERDLAAVQAAPPVPDATALRHVAAPSAPAVSVDVTDRLVEVSAYIKECGDGVADYPGCDDGDANCIFSFNQSGSLKAVRLASAPSAPSVSADATMLDWLQEQVVDVIYLDDGRFIDVKGNSVREAIRAAIAAQSKQPKGASE